MVVFVKCSTNNEARTVHVYNCFLVAIRQYGLPSRIRCDQGGENRLVAHHMIHHRGINRGSALVGSSVHNQRIERFWRDMHRCVIQTFYRLFYFTEHHNILNPVSELHLFALQYVFLPRITTMLCSNLHRDGTIMEFALSMDCHQTSYLLGACFSSMDLITQHWIFLIM